MVDYSINRWDKEYPGTAMVKMRAPSAQSARYAFLYRPATIPAERWFGEWDIVKAVIAQEAFFDFFVTDETILRKDKV